MRFVILNHGYEQFLTWLYDSTPGLAQQPFARQQAAYYSSLFGASDFYAHGLRSLGQEVYEFDCANTFAQSAWRCEHQVPPLTRAGALLQTLLQSAKLKSLPQWANRVMGAGPPPFKLLLDQVRSVRPDVLYNQSVYAFDDGQLQALKSHAGKLVGEHAAMPLPDSIDYRLYDLIVSSVPPTIEWLRRRGGHAELNQLAFDPRVASMVPSTTRDIRVSFVGSFFKIHTSRLELLQRVTKAVPDITIHGDVAIDVPPELNGKIGSALWGRDMYALLRRSMITLNHHGNVLPYANNMRLYEATGMGCLLLTDYKDNLREMFEPEKEVVTYRDAEECVDKIRFYLDDQNRSSREAIMAAGQRRTLREHTYEARMKRLLELIRSA